MSSSWGPAVGSPAGMGVVSLVDTTAGYVHRLEKVTRDQTAKIMQVIILGNPRQKRKGKHMRPQRTQSSVPIH